MATILTPESISSELDAAAPCLDVEACDGTCDETILGMAYDALCSFPAGVVVSRDTVEPTFGAPFSRLTARVDGDIVATTTRFWDIAEGLHDLLGYVTTALVDDKTAVLDGEATDRFI